jgi:hypothetical protein|tara:strand:- start:23511 stop:24695 length:1185 start_codon:yes stop_codon:yes gene_type:complete
MPNINKILSKVNQAKSAISSAKGIKSKLSQINYTSVINSNELEAQAEVAKQTLDKRRTSLEKSLNANNLSKNKAKKSPEGAPIELQYPLNEEHDNYIVFSSRQRINRQRRSEDGKMKQATGVGLSKDGNRASLMNTADSQVEIALHIPLTLEQEAAVQYSKKDVGALARGVQQGGAGGFISGMVQGLSQAAQKMLNSMTGNAMFIMQGKAVNPMQEMALEGVDFRELSFSYTMSPSSKEEADMINEIIYYFKTAMLPDTYPALGAGSSDAEGFFNYPNTWEAILEGPIAEKVDGYLPMVLKGCKVTYEGDSTSMTYYEDGQPTSIKMDLQFTELKILTQEAYQEITAHPNGKASGLKSMPSIIDQNATGDTTNIEAGAAAENAVKENASGKKNP